MKIKIIAISIVLIFLISGLCGCNDSNSNDKKIGDVEIKNIQVRTIASIPTNNTYNPIEEESSIGFDYGFAGDYQYRYVISGSIINIGDKPIEDIELTLRLYDSSNNELYTKNQHYRNLYKGDFENFEFNINEWYFDNFEYITDYNISKKVTYNELGL